MAINLVHRKDLDDRVERLAAQLGLSGRGRKNAIIERALTVLEESEWRTHIHSGPTSKRRSTGISAPAETCGSDMLTPAERHCRRHCRKRSTTTGACRSDRPGHFGNPGHLLAEDEKPAFRGLVT